MKNWFEEKFVRVGSFAWMCVIGLGVMLLFPLMPVFLIAVIAIGVFLGAKYLAS